MRADVVGVVDVCAVRDRARCEREPEGGAERWWARRERERGVLCGCADGLRCAADELGGERVDERDCARGQLRARDDYGDGACGAERVRGVGVGV